jgi:predicted transcriptional regulator
MKLSEVKELLDCELLTADSAFDPEETVCMGADMMSDVLAFARPGALLLTGLTNMQSVRTADIAEATGIVYVRGKRPDEQTVQLAEDMKIPLLSTEMNMFDACGILYSAGLKGIC